MIVGGSADGAVRFTAATGPELLDLFPGAEPPASATVVSGDAGAIAGSTELPSPPGATDAFRWRSDGTSVLLDPGGDAAGAIRPLGMSDDGNVIVGNAEFAPATPRAFWWSIERGLLPLKRVLDRHLAAPLTGWTLLEAASVSADGLTVVGRGVAPSGATEGWIARLEPECANGADDDGDGLSDSADPGCVVPQDLDEGVAPQCSDGVDNDGDGAVDFPGDPQCESASDGAEGTGCGLGVELLAVLPLLAWRRRRPAAG